MSDDEDSGDDDWGGYESGPFCRHWGSLGDCDELCARCGHSCNVHHDDDECGHEDCTCPGWDSGDDATKAENPQPKPGV